MKLRGRPSKGEQEPGAGGRDRILDAAVEVFAERGYHGAAVDDIVRASDTSKGTFYFHFPSKQDIFLQLADRLTDTLAGQVDEAVAVRAGAVAKVDAALESVLTTFAAHRHLAKILLIDLMGVGGTVDPKLLALHDRLARTIQGHLDRAVAEGSIPPIDTEIAGRVWLGAVNEVVVHWLHTGRPDPLTDALPPLRTLLMRSIGVSVETIAREEGEPQ